MFTFAHLSIADCSSSLKYCKCIDKGSINRNSFNLRIQAIFYHILTLFIAFTSNWTLDCYLSCIKLGSKILKALLFLLQLGVWKPLLPSIRVCRLHASCHKPPFTMSWLPRPGTGELRDCNMLAALSSSVFFSCRPNGIPGSGLLWLKL